MPKEWKQIIADEKLTDDQIVERLTGYTQLLERVESLATQIQQQEQNEAEDTHAQDGGQPPAESSGAGTSGGTKPQEQNEAEKPTALESALKRIEALEALVKKGEAQPPITPKPPVKKPYEIPRPVYGGKVWESAREAKERRNK